jgi:glycerol-3-phosphate acyltransferase PlsY
MNILKILIIFFFAFLSGSIPFGYLVSLLYRVDVRKKGSGNIGATNVLRAVGKFPAFFVLLLDILKGFIPVYITIKMNLNYGGWIEVLSGIFAILGHNYTPFLKFKGGKGVATSLGVLIALCGIYTLIPVFVFFVVLLISRYVSLSSLISSFSALIVFYFFPLPYFLFSVLAFLFIVVRHKDNIKRIINKTERKIGEKE